MKDESMLNEQNHQVAFVRKPNLTSFYYVHTINAFSKFGGFDNLLAILKLAVDS